MAQASHKRNRKKAAQTKHPLPGWVWLLAGLAIGLAVAAYFYMQGRDPTPPAQVAPAPAASIAPPAKPAAVKPKSDKPQTDKPRFDFYTILPEMEVVVPDTNKGERANSKASTYLLQVGSFRVFAEADNLKAQLALLGVESRIETVTGSDNDTWHRVRVGPYNDPRELNKIRTRLLNNNINAILLQIKG